MRQEYQGRLPLQCSRSWGALHSRTNSSSRYPREPHPVGPGRTDLCRHSQRTCYTRRPRKENLGSLLASPVSGHPGSQRTLSLIQARYWWPSMARDVSQFVRGCSVCVISKSPHHLPPENWYPYQSPVVRSPMSESTLPLIFPNLRDSPVFYLWWIDYLKLAS